MNTSQPKLTSGVLTRVNALLLLAVLGSALYLVNLQYESRRLFSALELANSEARKLAVEHERLQVEQQTQATTAMVERLAREKLHMQQASAGITKYVNYTAPAAALTTNPVAQPSAAGAKP